MSSGTSIAILGGILTGLLAALALNGCTSVSADLADGSKIQVVTFATSRQNIDIGRDPSGEHWRATESQPDQIMAQALLNLTQLLTKAPVPIP